MNTTITLSDPEWYCLLALVCQGIHQFRNALETPPSEEEKYEDSFNPGLLRSEWECSLKRLESINSKLTS